MRKLKTIDDIPTPALVMDIGRVENNVQRYQGIARRGEIKLRPHAKTTKLPHIWEMQRNAGAQGLTVATLREAEVARVHGHEDILIAYPHVDPSALARIQDLIRAGTKITILVANKEGANIVNEFFSDEKLAPYLMLAIDTGLHREGIHHKSENTLQFIEALQRVFQNRFLGVTTHEGHAYRAKQPKTVRSIAKGARDNMIALVRECRRQDIQLQNVALGSTPTFAYFENDRGRTITEAHPGNYVCMDNTQVQLGIAQPQECALTAIATVIGKRVVTTTHKGQKEQKGIVFVDAGAKVLSEAKRPHSEGGTAHGRIFSDLRAEAFLQFGQLFALSEEIGWIRVSPEDVEGDHPVFYVGQRVRILVQHACPAIAANRNVYFADGERVLGNVPIIAGGHEPYPKFRKLLKK